MAKTNLGLLEYAKAQVGLPYWYGTFGQTATETLYKNKKNQYPKYYTAIDFPTQYGKRVHDCVGLVKGYIWSETPTSTPRYNPTQDKGAKGMYNAATKKGKISTFPKTAGLLVFKSSTSLDTGINHVGVYDGNGYVYEAKGHSYGVVKTKFDSKWKFWAQCPYTTDDAVKTEVKTESTGTVAVKLNVLKKGSKGNQVKAVQRMLYAMGYDLGSSKVDGDFGSKTDSAVRAYQKSMGLSVDGSVGPKTWAKLLGTE